MFRPDSKELQTAVKECIKTSPIGGCYEGPHGPIGGWDVSAVTDMQSLFSGASSFNQDLSKWDVSAVTNMQFLFSGPSAFNQDLSKWDVSAVTDMKDMFNRASSFNRRLCGDAWVQSKAGKNNMFKGSKGSISSTVCKTAEHGYSRDYG